MTCQKLSLGVIVCKTFKMLLKTKAQQKMEFKGYSNENETVHDQCS